MRSVMKGRRGWVGASLAAITVLVAACGSTQSQVTVKDIATATRDAKTARFAVTSLNGHTLKSAPLTGDADFAQGRYRTHWDLRGSKLPAGVTLRRSQLTFDVVILPNHQYGRGLLFGSGWCEVGGALQDTAPKQVFGIDPSAALDSLRPPETLHRLGSDVIRGIAATRYRVLHAPSPSEDIPSPTEVWVDAQNQVLRVGEAIDTGDSNHPSETDFVDFYDFGASLTPITAPPHPMQCGD